MNICKQYSTHDRGVGDGYSTDVDTSGLVDIISITLKVHLINE